VPATTYAGAKPRQTRMRFSPVRFCLPGSRRTASARCELVELQRDLTWSTFFRRQGFLTRFGLAAISGGHPAKDIGRHASFYT